MVEKKYKEWIVLSFLMIVFLALGFMVKNSSQGILFDMEVMNLIHSQDRGILVEIMKVISFIGSGSFLIGAVLLVIVYNFIKKNYYISKLLLASTLGSYIVNFILKFLINRRRPIEFFLVEQSGLSFPSGHSMVAASMYLTIAYILSEKYKEKKTTIYLISTIIILLMGISRLFLGVHWPTDVIAGFIMGYLFYRLIITFIKSPSK